MPNEEFFGTLSYLMLALQAIITSSGNFGETGQKKAILIMMQAIYGLIIEDTENNGKKMKNSIRNCSSTTFGSRLLSWVFVGGCALSAELMV